MSETSNVVPQDGHDVRPEPTGAPPSRPQRGQRTSMRRCGCQLPSFALHHPKVGAFITSPSRLGTSVHLSLLPHLDRRFDPSDSALFRVIYDALIRAIAVASQSCQGDMAIGSRPEVARAPRTGHQRLATTPATNRPRGVVERAGVRRVAGTDAVPRASQIQTARYQT